MAAITTALTTAAAALSEVITYFVRAEFFYVFHLILTRRNCLITRSGIGLFKVSVPDMC
jgi:hypothetical protein